MEVLPIHPTFAEIIKGDVDGHPFHGNQWTGGEGSAEGALLTGDQVKSAVMSPQGINEFNRIMSKQGYLTYPNNHPLWGGCGVVMKALQNIYPQGKPVAIGEPIRQEESDDPPIFVQHYALQIGEDKFVDGAGERTLAEIGKGSVLSKYWVVMPATKEIVGAFKSIATCTDQEAKEYADALIQAGASSEVKKGDIEGHIFHGNQWVAGSLDELTKKIEQDHPEVKLDISEKNDNISLTRIVVPKDQRNSGIGTQIMRHITNYADSKGITVSLTPSTEYGGNKSGLERFYRSLGFVPNKGRTADTRISDSWIRRSPITKGELTYTEQLVAFAKGDLPGHDFHGNQYTLGMGGTTPDGRSYEKLEARAKEIAKELGYGDYPKFAENLVRVAANSKTLADYAGVTESGRGHLKLANLVFDRIGNNEPPKVLSQSEFDKYRSKLPPLFTGISTHRSPAEDKIADFAYGKGVKIGAGAFGRAWYSTTNAENAQYYASSAHNGEVDGGVMKLKLQADSKVLDYNKAVKALNNAESKSADILKNIDAVAEMLSAGKPQLKDIAETAAQTIVAGDENIRLAMMGVDALTAKVEENGNSYVMILNRGKLVMSDTYDKVSPSGLESKPIPAEPSDVIKGDKPGHEFHGNQWVIHGTDGAILQHQRTFKELWEARGQFQWKIYSQIRDRANESRESNQMSFEGNIKMLVAHDLTQKLGTKFDDRLVDSAEVDQVGTFKEFLATLGKNDFVKVSSPGEFGGKTSYDGYITQIKTDSFSNKTPAQQYKDYVKGLKNGTSSPLEPIFRATDPALTDAVRQMSVSRILNEWAQTSNDGNPTSLAIQQAVADQFGLENTASWKMLPELKKAVSSEYEKNGDLYRALAKAQYKNTQDTLKKEGIKDVQVFRGYKFAKGEEPKWAKKYGLANVSTRPLSSFASDFAQAEKFAFQAQTIFVPGAKEEFQKEDLSNIHGAVITGIVPANKVFSLPSTGFGCYKENEVTLLGDTQQWQVITSPDQWMEVAPRPKDEDFENITENSIIKGESAGHPFRGNQWETGEGDSPISFIQRNIKEFYDAGGKITVVSGDRTSAIQKVNDEITKLKKKEYESMPKRQQLGIDLMGAAVKDVKGKIYDEDPDIKECYLLVARDKDKNLAAVVSVSVKETEKYGNYVDVGYLGSTGKVPGAATAIEEQIAQIANDRGLPVQSKYIPDSKPYHQLLGRSLEPDNKWSKWNEEQARQIAALENPKARVLKGESEGHQFHGNQRTTGEAGHANTSVMEEGVIGDLTKLFGKPDGRILGSMTQIDNEDWLKYNSWDLYRVGKLITTLPDLLWSLGVSNGTTTQQLDAVENFTHLPVWNAAPQTLKDEVSNFLKD